jgi:hypothetical protein
MPEKMHSFEEEKEDPKQEDLGRIKLLYCGFLSGLISAGIFNPWDRLVICLTNITLCILLQGIFSIFFYLLLISIALYYHSEHYIYQS